MAATGYVGGAEAERLAVSDDGQVVVAFAGSLYDEDVARKQRPAAYCLELYQRHGPGFAAPLNGTLAIVVYDGAAGQLHLISDRMASRALYYSTHAPFVFGTEVKLLLEYPGMSRRANADRLREFLVMESLLGTATYYDHIRQTPSATVLTWEEGRRRALRYWTPEFTWDRHGSLDDHARQIAAALQNSLRRVVAGHERIGLMLSASPQFAGPGLRHRPSAHVHDPAHEPGVGGRAGSAGGSGLGQPHHAIQLSETYPLELVRIPVIIGDEGMHAARQGRLHRRVVQQGGPPLLRSRPDCGPTAEGMPTENQWGFWRRIAPGRPHTPCDRSSFGRGRVSDNEGDLHLARSGSARCPEITEFEPPADARLRRLIGRVLAAPDVPRSVAAFVASPTAHRAYGRALDAHRRGWRDPALVDVTAHPAQSPRGDLALLPRAVQRSVGGSRRGYVATAGTIAWPRLHLDHAPLSRMASRALAKASASYLDDPGDRGRDGLRRRSRGRDSPGKAGRPIGLRLADPGGVAGQVRSSRPGRERSGIDLGVQQSGSAQLEKRVGQSPPNIGSLVAGPDRRAR